MKATYILALVAALAVSANAWEAPTVKDSKIQQQEADGNNAQYASSDDSLVGAAGAVQGGAHVIGDTHNSFTGVQGQKQ